MNDIVRATLRLYQHALRATLRSFGRSWVIAIAVVVFAIVMVGVTFLVSPLGILGGFVLGALNALVIGATLSLIEQAVTSSRSLGWHDIRGSVGQYFWDVIGVGFVLWVPMLLLEQGMATNPNGPFFAAAIFLLLFILLNPAPEVIYQVRHSSPLDVLRLSYLGLPSEAGSTLVIVLTPPAAVAMLIFRGHLFAALHRSSRRQRIFQGRGVE